MKKYLIIFILTITALSLLSGNSFLNRNSNITLLQTPNQAKKYNIEQPDSLFFLSQYDIIKPSDKPTIKTIHDKESKTVKLQLFVRDVPISDPVVLTYSEYYDFVFSKEYDEILNTKVMNLLRMRDRDSGSGIFKEFTIKLPRVALPKPIKLLMGDEAARFNVEGSQKLSLSYENIKNDIPSSTNSRDSNFEMRQDLNLQLKGKIGKKIHLNITHQSASGQTLSDPNKVDIKYVGDEDEVVKSIEAGDIGLSLGGSQYISYSANSKGLFGVKVDMVFGNLKLKTIMGTEEGQKGSTSKNDNSDSLSNIIRSKNFSKRFYCVENPSELFELIQVNEDEYSQVPSSWHNNAVQLVDNGEWVVAYPDKLPSANYFHVFIDDTYDQQDNLKTDGVSIDPTDTKAYRFKELQSGSDYLVDYDTGIIQFFSDVNVNQAIGVVYQRLNGEMVGDYSDQNMIYAKIIKKSNQDANDDTWYNQMRNIYTLSQTENMKDEDFFIEIYQGNTEDGTREIYIEHEGLDIEMTYNDYLRLDTSGDDKYDSQDGTINFEAGYVIFPMLEPFKYFEDEDFYQTKNIADNNVEIHTIGSSPVGDIDLNQLNIIRGSVVVTVNGETMIENKDYTVDYDFGTVKLISPRTKIANAKVKVDFEYVPLFAVKSKTILGVRADYKVNDFTNFGSTLIYHSESMKEDRPKIGHENKIQIMGDIDGEFKVKPYFITEALDWLPLIKTDAESEIVVSGEVAFNAPKLYGKDDEKDDPEAYVDDMESIIDSYSLGTSSSTWSPSSLPYLHHGLKAKWFNWHQNSDVKSVVVYGDNIPEDEKTESVTMLKCQLVPNEMSTHGTSSKSWGGIMKFIGTDVDFSEKKYIEILLNVDGDSSSVIHVDLGRISEDFYTDNGGWGILNEEDGKNEGTKDGILDFTEDTGLDMIPDGNYGDDKYDDYSNSEKASINGVNISQLYDLEYPLLNKSEGNGTLDSEDLDSNNNLDTNNNYFEFSFAYNDPKYLVSVFKYQNNPEYRLFRIPIESNNYEILSDSNIDPNLEEISYARIWFESSDRTDFNLVTMDIVGNKWEEMAIRDTSDTAISDILLKNSNESYTSGVLNTKNDVDRYSAPPGTKEDDAHEQAVYMDFKNIAPGHYAILSQEFLNAINFLNYEELRLFAYLEKDETEVPYNDSLDFVFRIGADSVSYYEYAIRLAPNQQNLNVQNSELNWKEYTIRFDELTKLKNFVVVESDDIDSTYYSTELQSLITLRKRETPTLTNIKNIFIGIKVPEESEKFSGRLIVDDIRVGKPFNDIGYAARTTVNTKFADVLTINFDLDKQTPNFYQIRNVSANATQRYMQEQYTATTLSVNSTLHLDKFTPYDWGLKVPLKLSHSESSKVPKFKASSDILYEDLTETEKDRERERKQTRSISADFSHSNITNNPVLKYSLSALKFNGSIIQKKTKLASKRDTTLSYTEDFKYNITLPKEKLNFGLWKEYKYYYIPQKFNNTVTFKSSSGTYYRYDKTDKRFEINPSGTKPSRTLDHVHSVDYQIFSDFTTGYDLTISRDLKLKRYRNNINIGTPKTRKQKIDLSYTPNYFDRFCSVSASYEIYYDEKTTHTVTSGVDNFQYTYSMDKDFSLNMGFKNKEILDNIWEKFGWNKHESFSFLPGTKEKGEEKPEIDRDKYGKLSDEEKNKFEKEMSEKFAGKEYSDEEFDKFLKERGVSKEDYHKELEEKEKEKESDDKKEESKVSSSREGMFNPVSFAFSRLLYIHNITGTFTTDYRNGYNKVDSLGGNDYMFGLRKYAAIDDKFNSEVQGYSLRLGSGYLITRTLDTDIDYSYSYSESFSQSGPGTYNESTTFPSLRTSYRNIHEFFIFKKLLGSIMSSSSITSSFSLRKDETGDVPRDDYANASESTTIITEKVKDSESETISFQPLISFSGSIRKYKLDTSFSYNTSNSKRIAYSNNGGEININTIKETNTNSFSASLNHRMTKAKGIYIPVLKKRLRFKNEFTTNITGNWEESKVMNTDKYDVKSLESHTQKLSFSLGGSYEFHRNINGGSSIMWSSNKNLKKKTEIRSMTFEVWVEILF